MPKTPGFSDRGFTRRDILRATAGLTVAAATLMLTGCAPSASGPAEVPRASAPADPGDKGDKGNDRWLPKRGDFLAANKLGELGGDHDKLVTAFTLRQSDYTSFEELAQLLNYADTSYLLSGTSNAEIAAHRSAPGQFDEYASETYAEPFAEATSHDGVVDHNLDNNHKIIASQTIATQLTDSDVKYAFNQQLEKVISTQGDIKDKTCTVVYLAKRTDNLAESSLGQVNAGQSMADRIKVTATVYRMDDGSIKTTTHWGAVND